MKLFSKTLARILGKKEEEPEKAMIEPADLIVFNQGEKYEFGECAGCGAEIDKNEEANNYPIRCPKCGRFFDWTMKAEEVE